VNSARNRIGLVIALLLVAAGGLAFSRLGHDKPAPQELSFGPLGSPGPGHDTLCTPSPKGVAYIGLTPLENTGTRPLTLDSVQLVQAHDLRLSAAFLVPFIGNQSFGQFNAPPPSSDPAWAQRVPLNGAVVSARSERNLVLVVATKKGRGSALDTEIMYRDALGHRYHFFTQLTLVVDRASRCSS